MTQVRPINVQEIIQALRELGGEATWKEIREQVRSNRGTDHAHYKDRENFDRVVNHYIQLHCCGFSYEKYTGPPHFEYIRRGHVRLIKHPHPNDDVALEHASGDDEQVDEIERIIREQSVIVRNLDLVRKIKRIYGYTCQICDTSIQLPGGERYVEVHHIQPLGRNHNGPDHIENMLCVCPNDHVRLHGGAIRLEKGMLRLAPGHHILDKYIEYHNSVICKLSG